MSPQSPLPVLNFEVLPPVEAVEFEVTNSTFAFEVKAPLPGGIDTVSLGFSAGDRILTMTAGGGAQRAFLRAVSLPMAVDEAKIQSCVTAERKLVLYLPKRGFAVGNFGIQESKRRDVPEGDAAAMKRTRRLDWCHNGCGMQATVGDALFFS